MKEFDDFPGPDSMEPSTMALPANLDAFLTREDFFADPDPSKPVHPEFHEIGLSDLKETYVGMMRKPDFQRTTAAWDPKRISQFVKSFCEGDLIPGVIFWNSPTTGNILVIDGAHRISALLAWIHDDYGDRGISKDFLGYQHNQDQADSAELTRQLVKKSIGSFDDIWKATENTSAEKKHIEVSPRAKKRKIPVQWVHGDAKTVTESFFRINLQGVSLDRIEKKLITSRQTSIGIATRVIVQCGAGHPYWRDFAQSDKDKTIAKGKEIHELLFSPPLKQPVKDINLPIGGKSHAGNAMELALELVEFANNQRTATGAVGPVTVEVLQKTWRVLSLINGDDGGCLGLHPAVYFYSHATGKHHPTAFMAVVRWIASLSKPEIERFTVVRSEFEEFLISNSAVIKEIISRRGSSGRAAHTLSDFYNLVFKSLENFLPTEKIFEDMKENKRLAPFATKIPDFNEYGPNFSSEVKASTYIRDALKAAATTPCRICGARYHPNSVNCDHIIEKSKGGRGNPENARATHYYCNSNRENLEALISSRKQRLKLLS
jgi:hypothetical protein